MDNNRIMNSQPNRSLKQSVWASIAVAAIPVMAACVAGQVATFPNLAPWYAELVKPAFNPPNWLFGPVWTSLYLLMAYAVWRILKIPPDWSGRRAALRFFFAQLALNALWPWLFFGLHSPLAGLAEIIPQFLLVVATLVSFSRLDKIATACLVPLAGWVAFASVLNLAIWQLNG